MNGGGGGGRYEPPLFCKSVYFRHLKVSQVKADFVFVYLHFNIHSYQTNSLAVEMYLINGLLNCMALNANT